MYVDDEPMQNGVYIARADRRLIPESLEIEIFGNPYMPARMKLGGFVFEDIPQTKESIANGQKDQNDINLKNIEVALIDAETGKLAHLTTLQEENPNASSGEINDLDDYGRRINPTLTDENGYYEFRGVSREKKYYVQFTYNGQIYTATEYLSDTGADTVVDVAVVIKKEDNTVSNLLHVRPKFIARLPVGASTSLVGGRRLCKYEQINRRVAGRDCVCIIFLLFI